MLRNVAGQAIGAQINHIATGEPYIGPVTVYVTGDRGAQTLGSVGGGVCTDEGHGYFSYAPSQAETNYELVAFTFTGPNAITATVQVATITEAQARALATSTVTVVIGDGPTRIELLKQLAHRLNKIPPPQMDSATETRLASYINQRQRRLLTLPGMARLRDATTTFTSVAGQATYGLPNLAKVKRLVDVRNERLLYEMSAQDHRLVQPVPQSGTPEAYVWTGRQVVALQPSMPSTLWVQSSSASDTVPLVHLEGALASGYAQTAVVQLRGLTPVNVSSAVSSWARIDKLHLSSPCQGVVSLNEGAGAGPLLAMIQAGQLVTVYEGLTLYPTPTDPLVYSVDITRTVTDLLRDSDQAALPVDFSDVLVLGALADEYQHLADQRWSQAVSEYKERENQLKYWLSETATGRPWNLIGARQEPSQLGPWFPAGS